MSSSITSALLVWRARPGFEEELRPASSDVTICRANSARSAIVGYELSSDTNPLSRSEASINLSASVSVAGPRR